MSISFERAFSIHDDAMIFRARRSSVLASNIANTDTPNYKARDIDFTSMLSDTMNTQNEKLKLSGTHVKHLSADTPAFDQSLKYRNPLHASLDGNTVDAHVEQAKFAENALQYQTSFTFLDSRIKGLINALKGE